MPFQEAIQATEEAEGSKLEMNVKAFTDEENNLGESVQDVLIKAQDQLDQMHEYMETELNKDELRVANLAIERELEKSIPNRFKSAYEQAGTWPEAADLITEHILSNIQDFAASRLKKIVEIVDDESWIGSPSKDEVEDILKDIDPNISKGDIAALQAKYQNPYLTDNELAIIREQSDVTIAQKTKDIISGKTTERRLRKMGL